MKKINVICTSYSGPKEIEIEPDGKAIHKIIPEYFKQLKLEKGVVLVLPRRCLPDGFKPYQSISYLPTEEIDGTFIVVGYKNKQYQSLTPAQIEKYLYQIWEQKLC